MTTDDQSDGDTPGRERAAAGRAMSVADALSMATEWHQKGRLREAEAVYRQIAAKFPDNADVLNRLAVCLYDRDRFDEAIEIGTRVVELTPDSPAARFNLGNALREAGSLRAAATSYERALQLEPSMIAAHIALGQVYKAAGDSDRAYACFRRALALDPGSSEAKRLTGHLAARLVPRWHFPMLNDERRNRAFETAIRKAVQPSSTVLDIGTGSGLLAMMAAKAGARHVIACEVIHPIAEAARRIIAANGLSDHITVVHKRSTQLALGTDLESRVDVIIAEILDAGLVGEGVVPVLHRARQSLALPDATIIPKAATVYGMLVDSIELVQQERVGMAAGFDVSPFNEFALPGYAHRRLREFEYRALSEPFEVFHFDFTSDVADARKRTIEVRPIDSGQCQVVAFWFRLFLDDEVSFDTGPGTSSSHWHQAVQLMDARSISRNRPVEVIATYDVDTISFEMV